MTPISKRLLTIPVYITLDSGIDFAIEVFNQWCATNFEADTKKQYGFKRLNQTKGEFFITTTLNYKSEELRRLILELEFGAMLLTQSIKSIILDE